MQKTKRFGMVVCTLAAAVFTPGAPAQQAHQTQQVLQASPSDSTTVLAKIQSDKRSVVVVGKTMQLTPDEATRFWPLYDKFQRELEMVNRRQARAVLDYVAADGKLTDANADRIARDLLEANVEEAKLRQRQYVALKKVLPPAKAVRDAQIENKIEAVKRIEAAKAIPLVE
jgi:hypothetical protein